MSSDLHSNASGVDLHEDKRIKQPVRVSLTTNVTLTAPGASIDGVALTSGDRFLLTGQTAPAQNGIYIWNGAASTATRSTDAATAFDFSLGFLVYVSEGVSYANSVWLFTTTSAITLGTTSLSFVQFTATGPTGPTGATGVPGAQGPPGTFTVTGAPPYINLQDQKTSGTSGGTFTNGAFRTRDLNTVHADIYSLCTLNNSNQFTLPAGTYQINARLPARAVGNHNARLQNITTSATQMFGSTARTDAASQAQTDSFITGQFSIASITTFEVQHQCITTLATSGFGLASSFANTPEIYTVVELWLIGGAAIPPGDQVFQLPQSRRRVFVLDVDMPPQANNLLPA